MKPPRLRDVFVSSMMKFTFVTLHGRERLPRAAERVLALLGITVTVVDGGGSSSSNHLVAVDGVASVGQRVKYSVADPW